MLEISKLIAMQKAQTESKPAAAAKPNPLAAMMAKQKESTNVSEPAKSIELASSVDAANFVESPSLTKATGQSPAGDAERTTGGANSTQSSVNAPSNGNGASLGNVGVADSGSDLPALSLPVKPAGFKLTLAGAAKATALSTQRPESKPASVSLLNEIASNESHVTLPSLSDFEDEIEATVPARIYPDDATVDLKKFGETLDSVYVVLGDAEMFGQMIRVIMQELADNPEYAKLLADEDIRVMIRGMRSSMGMARVKKQEAKAKRTGASKTKAIDADMAADLAALGL